MKPNPILKNLGFSNDTRVVIIHADDVGMCHASAAAYSDLVDFGLISSASTMVPCPWFLQVAAYARDHPAIDLGVHLTLTSEWEKYRWGPISTRDPASGLLDDEGYFFHSSAQAQEHGDIAPVQSEIEAQLARAFQAGIDVTHLDSHMMALGHPKYVAPFLQLGVQNHLPILYVRMAASEWSSLNLSEEVAQIAASLGEAMEAVGYPLVDAVTGLSLSDPSDRLERAKAAFSNIKNGITHFMIHPAIDTPELRAITPDWACRVADYQTFTNPAMRDYIRDSGIQVIGYRHLKKLVKTD